MTTSTPTIIQSRLDELLNGGRLAFGSHGADSGERCAMEWVSYLSGEQHSDHPPCTSPVLACYVIGLNDRWPDEQRQALAPYLPRLVGTAGDGMEDARREIARQALVTDLLPAWLRLAGMDTEADALARTSLDDLPGVLREIRSAAWDRRHAALEPICQGVRAAVQTKLAERPAAAADAAAAVAADAAAVAAVDAAAAAVDAVAVAAVDAAAAAAVAADAAAVVAAVAAAVAVDAVVAVVVAVDAVVAAVAAAAVDAVAVAAVADAVADDPWGVSYNAAYRAARPIFEKAIAGGTAPRLQMVRELAEAQRTVALDVLDRMIKPEAVAQ